MKNDSELEDGMVEWQGEEYKVIREGKVTLLYPKGGEVFYNRIQEFNRDVSVIMMKLFCEEWRLKRNGKAFTILEALAATGLRSIRYAKELDDYDCIIANDIDPNAVSSIGVNREYNGVDESKFRIYCEDANFLFHKMKGDAAMMEGPVSVIDLDPYGGANIFLDGALKLIGNGGMLAVTCTDLAVLCGNNMDSCFAKYGSFPLKGVKYCHEMAIRILLYSISTHAARHKKYIVPLVSLFADFYVRVFVRVGTHGNELKRLPDRLGYLYQCMNCDNRSIQKMGRIVGKSTVEEGNKGSKLVHGEAPSVDPRCVHCDGSWRMGGPMWIDAINDRVYLDAVLDHLSNNDANSSYYGTYKRIRGTFSAMREELSDVPFFYTLENLANTLHLETPPLNAFRSAIFSQGCRLSGSHCRPGSVKTDAKYELILEIMKNWHLVKPAKLENISENSPAHKILTVPPKMSISFAEIEEAKVKRFFPTGEKIGRYQVNPPNWGPGTRAGKKRTHPSTPSATENQKKSTVDHTPPQKEIESDGEMASIEMSDFSKNDI